jgi:hypothetical protein
MKAELVVIYEHVGNISQPAGHEFLFRHWQHKKLTPFFGGIQ